MKKKPKIVILIGNIGSGKSTIATHYAKKGYIIVARDALRYDIGAGNYVFNPKIETAIWKTELDMLYNFMEYNVNILVDEVGIDRLMRHRYIEMTQHCFPHYQIIGIEMPRLSMKEAVNRRMRNPHGQPDRKLWEQVWTKFEKQYELPTKEEGFHKIVRMK